MNFFAVKVFFPVSCILTIFVRFAFSGDAVHFKPVAASGQSQPVIIQNAQINELPLRRGDEVGVFDDTLCVGATAFDSTYNLVIIVWQEVKLPGNIVKKGGRKGVSMQLRIWQQTTATEGIAVPTFDPESSGVFGELITVIALLEGNCPVEEPPLKNEIYFYPNPFYPEKEMGAIRFMLEKTDNLTIRIFDTAGFLVKTLLENESHSGGVETDIHWDGRNQAGVFVSNGAYFYFIESATGFRASGRIAVFR